MAATAAGEGAEPGNDNDNENLTYDRLEHESRDVSNAREVDSPEALLKCSSIPGACNAEQGQASSATKVGSATGLGDGARVK